MPGNPPQLQCDTAHSSAAPVAASADAPRGLFFVKCHRPIPSHRSTKPPQTSKAGPWTCSNKLQMDPCSHLCLSGLFPSGKPSVSLLEKLLDLLAHGEGQGMRSNRTLN